MAKLRDGAAEPREVGPRILDDQRDIADNEEEVRVCVRWGVGMRARARREKVITYRLLLVS